MVKINSLVDLCLWLWWFILTHGNGAAEKVDVFLFVFLKESGGIFPAQNDPGDNRTGKEHHHLCCTNTTSSQSVERVIVFSPFFFLCALGHSPVRWLCAVHKGHLYRHWNMCRALEPQKVEQQRIVSVCAVSPDDWMNNTSVPQPPRRHGSGWGWNLH